MAKINLDDYIQVTDKNREHAVVLGRVIYVISGKTERGRIIIRPQLRRGKITIDNDPAFKNKTYTATILRDETREEWIEAHKPVLDKVISEGLAYIKKGEELVKHTQ